VVPGGAPALAAAEVANGEDRQSSTEIAPLHGLIEVNGMLFGRTRYHPACSATLALKEYSKVSKEIEPSCEECRTKWLMRGDLGF